MKTQDFLVKLVCGQIKLEMSTNDIDEMEIWMRVKARKFRRQPNDVVITAYDMRLDESVSNIVMQYNKSAGHEQFISLIAETI